MNYPNSRQGKIFDDYSNPDVSLHFVSYNDIEDLCDVINWAYRGKPSTSSPGEYYCGWTSDQQWLARERMTPEELKQLIDDEQHNIIIVAKLKTNSKAKIIHPKKFFVPYRYTGEEPLRFRNQCTQFILRSADSCETLKVLPVDTGSVQKLSLF